MKIPSSIDENVKKLMIRLGCNTDPVYLPVTPEPYVRVNECFPAVKEKIKREGGECQLGWQVWIIPNILIEGVFHAVWKSPNDKLVDITPKPENIEKILFIPDMKAKYNGAQVNDIRLNISNSCIVDDFIKVCDAIYLLENKGIRAFQNLYSLSKNEMYIDQTLRLAKSRMLNFIKQGGTRNTPCFCGSGYKYKKCHGVALDILLRKTNIELSKN